MKLTPRASEVKAVVTLLEATDYDTAEALAKDVIKKVCELLTERDLYAYANRFEPGLVLAWGPFSSETEVNRFAVKAALGGEHLAVKLYSTAALLDRIEESDKGLNRFCTSCKHPLGAHEHPKVTRCQVGGCPCQQATK